MENSSVISCGEKEGRGGKTSYCWYEHSWAVLGWARRLCELRDLLLAELVSEGKHLWTGPPSHQPSGSKCSQGNKVACQGRRGMHS